MRYILHSDVNPSLYMVQDDPYVILALDEETNRSSVVIPDAGNDLALATKVVELLNGKKLEKPLARIVRDTIMKSDHGIPTLRQREALAGDVLADISHGGYDIT